MPVERTDDELLRATLAAVAPGTDAARRPRADPARPHRRADRARPRPGRRDALHRRLPARRRVLRHPAARAGQDGRRDRPRPRRHPDPARRRPAGARPLDRDHRVRHPAPHRRAGGQADRLPGDLGEPVDADRRPLRRRPPATCSRARPPSCPGPTRPWRRSSATRPASTRSPARCPPSRSRTWSPSATSPSCCSASRWCAGSRRDRRLRRRARHRRPAAHPAAGRAHRRPGQRPRAGHPRLPARRRAAAAQRRRGARRPRRALSSTELLDLAAGARALGFSIVGDALDAAVSPRGYRLLSKVPRLPGAIVDRLVDHFGNLQKLLAANLDDLHGRRGRRRGPGPRRPRGPVPPGRVQHPRALRLTRRPHPS